MCLGTHEEHPASWMLRKEQHNGVEWDGKVLDHGISGKSRRVNTVSIPFQSPEQLENGNDLFVQVSCLNPGTHLNAFQERPQVFTNLPNVQVTCEAVG